MNNVTYKRRQPMRRFTRSGPILQFEQPKFLTGWVPVVKIFSTKSQAVRTLWLIFTICMVVALVSSISVVVHRYLTYVTVVRLDQRGPQDGVPPPAVTICLAEHQTDNMLQVSHNSIPLKSGNIVQGISRKCDHAYTIHWESKRDAVSPLYALGGHFRVTLRTVPLGCYMLRVLEQVTSPPNSVCTSFELSSLIPQNATFWKTYQISVELTDKNRSFIGRPLVIVHERNTFPLDKFGQYLYEYLEPGSTHNIFAGKIVTKRLSTGTNPCRRNRVQLLGYPFKYDQVACQWLAVCEFYHSRCNCFCPLDVVHRYASIRYPQSAPIRTNHSTLHIVCPLPCQHNHPIALVNSSVCPSACRTVTFNKLNQVLDKSDNLGRVTLSFIQAEGLTEMTEEELYSLPKLFSEIGGLSSFCFGFSFILFFELFELMLWLRCTYRAQLAAHVNEILSQLQYEINAEDISFSGGVLHNQPAEGLDLQYGKQKGDSSSKVVSHPECHKSISLSRSCSPISHRAHHLVYKHSPRRERIALDPLKLCRVDGSRLSEYPCVTDSPIAGLKSSRLPQLSTSPAACASVLIENIHFSSGEFRVVSLAVSTLTGTGCYLVPMEIGRWI